MNVRVEYECTPIRHIAIQCPNCMNWFHGFDVTKDDLLFDYQIGFAKCHCPICDIDFGYDSIFSKDLNIQEIGYPEVYKDCLSKKETWE